MFKLDRRIYLGFTIGRLPFSSRWIVCRGRARVGCAPSAFDAVELIDRLVDAQAIEALLHRGDPLVSDSPARRQERNDAINGKNPSPVTIAENIARASFAIRRDLSGLPEASLVRVSREDVTEAAASRSPDIDAFLNSPAIAAKRREERVLSLRLAEQVAVDPEAFRKAVSATSDTGESEPLEVDRRDRPLWDTLEGAQNTTNILARKGRILSKIIAMGLEDGKFAASIVSSHGPTVLLIPKYQDCLAAAETGAFLLYIVNLFARKFTTITERAALMPAVEAHLKEEIKALGCNQVDFSNLLSRRHAEYGKYHRWSIEINEDGRPLFWDFSAKISEILGIGKNYMFNLILTTLLLRKINDWNLPRLLSGK